MKTEREKMLSGELYNPLDEELCEARLRARLLFKALNRLDEGQAAEKSRIIRELLPDAGEGLWLEPPFYCDYGTHIRMGERVFINFNCVILDVAHVTIGARTLVGPNVQIYAASHPLDYRVRAAGLESGRAVFIGEDVWIGGNVVICPGVRIGARSVIGAGSVVTKDIPADVMAAGNPCKIIRQLDPQ